MAAQGLSCIMWGLVPWPTMKHGLPTFGVLSLPLHHQGSLKTDSNSSISFFVQCEHKRPNLLQNLSIKSVLPFRLECNIFALFLFLLHLSWDWEWVKSNVFHMLCSFSWKETQSTAPWSCLPSGRVLSTCSTHSFQGVSYLKSWLVYSFFQILTTRQQSLTINGNHSFRWNWIEYSFSFFLGSIISSLPSWNFNYAHAVYSPVPVLRYLIQGSF